MKSLKVEGMFWTKFGHTKLTKDLSCSIECIYLMLDLHKLDSKEEFWQPKLSLKTNVHAMIFFKTLN